MADINITKTEEKFHDVWAASVAVDEIDVEAMFEACTIPRKSVYP